MRAVGTVNRSTIISDRLLTELRRRYHRTWDVVNRRKPKLADTTKSAVGSAGENRERAEAGARRRVALYRIGWALGQTVPYGVRMFW